MMQVEKRVRWSEREKKPAVRLKRPGRRKGSTLQVDPQRINNALASNDPDTLMVNEVSKITGLSSGELRGRARRGEFPSPINIEERGWRKWASVDVYDWLVENKLPTRLEE